MRIVDGGAGDRDDPPLPNKLPLLMVGVNNDFPRALGVVKSAEAGLRTGVLGVEGIAEHGGGGGDNGRVDAKIGNAMLAEATTGQAAAVGVGVESSDAGGRLLGIVGKLICLFNFEGCNSDCISFALLSIDNFFFILFSCCLACSASSKALRASSDSLGCMAVLVLAHSGTTYFLLCCVGRGGEDAEIPGFDAGLMKVLVGLFSPFFEELGRGGDVQGSVPVL